MSSSRENSPDWLRSFQPPASSTLVLSSDSEPSYAGSPLKEDRTDSEELSIRKYSEGEDDDDEDLGKVLGGDGDKKSKLKSPEKGTKLEDDISPGKNKSDKPKKRKGDNDGDKKAAKKVKGLKHEVLSLSSDSEPSSETSPVRRNRTARGRSSEQIDETKDEKSPSKMAAKDKSSRNEPEGDARPSTKEKKKRDVKRKGDGSDVEVAEEEAPEKQVESQASSARLPLMLSDKVQRTKALVECEGDSIDLAGDMGSVGRVVISDTLSGDHEMYLDMKGTIYKTTIVPSRTFCVVSFGQSEAKIEAIMNDFIQLKPQSNVFEAETMVEGTLDGFSFDSDEEADKVPKGIGQETNEDGETKANGKSKGKAEKKSSVGRKRGKAAGGKSQPQKKKKAQPSKKAKTKK